MVSVFDFSDYKEFLRAVLGAEGARTGQRAALAKHLGCQTAFVSQVLNKPTVNFSAEQAIRINKFLGHSESESHYFILLLNKERAGSKELEAYYQKQIEDLQEHQRKFKTRIYTNKEVSELDQTRYYSSWLFSAIHIALSVPSLQTRDAIAKAFYLPPGTVQSVLEFLVDKGLAERTADKFVIGPSHVHLGKDSDNVPRHHANWRVQALESLDRSRLENLHYTGVVSLSASDAERIKENIRKMIAENLKIVKNSPEEVLYCTTIDFFDLNKAK